MFCFHKYGPIEGVYQYCSKCGKAILMPCDHEWELYDTLTTFMQYDNTKINNGKVFIQKCSKCGEMKEFRVRS